MPAPRMRRRDDRVDYVVVRRTGANGVEEEDHVEPMPNPTATVNNILDRAHDRRQALSQPSTTGTKNGRAPPPPPPVLVTMTLSQSQQTGVAAALADSDPSATVVVAISPPPQPPPGGHPEGHKGGFSQTTQHLLIAAGSIGATIIIVMIILGIHTMRKRGLTLAEALRAGRYQVTHGGPPPPPKYQTEYRDTKHSNDYGSLRNQSVTPPQPAMARSSSNSSQRPLMALERSDSFNRSLDRRPSTRTASSPTRPKSFVLASAPPARNPSHRRNESATPSSNAIGTNTNNARKSVSTRNTRSIGDEESELQYNDSNPQQDRPLSPLPPPPTFKQFLFNRPSISAKQGIGNVMSRFSWTNSNAPQTPHDPARDTNSHAQAQGRDSYMTARSSVPRFRTIDSWVNQQTNRLEEQKLKEQFRLTSTSTVYSEDSEALDTVPEVPAMPKNVRALRESSAQISSQLPNRRPATPPGLPGLPGRNVKHQRHNTGTTVDTAPIFRQHPGTEVRFSTKSAVPSEILDRGRDDSVLS
ncbi:hypothetical protein P280DRAFT_154779 [Massarina eburnea CBS 473.64]|uniref:Uncharacterized protein n=1 Tax=Massarina eburnea CBS 473.64 TaxID=1395130 RepID=A0A6A6RNV5_9PLEO|nr:hypothetical protein P280DRAFT_154779 [Massarina eburnea CBS 473.64]